MQHKAIYLQGSADNQEETPLIVAKSTTSWSDCHEYWMTQICNETIYPSYQMPNFLSI